MDESAWLAERFEEHRAHLRAVAYRMLGSLTEADDAVQDTWLRLSRSGAHEVENLGGWLTTVVARVCLNMLRARTVRREESLAVHVPDPLVRPDGDLQPEEAALLAEAVSLALLVVLDTLAPAERVAFVLHDMFAVPFEEIAPLVERTPTAARQLASRARRRSRAPPYRLRTPISHVNARWSTLSSWLRVGAMSMPSSPCSIPTSCCASMRAPGTPQPPWCSRAQPPWPGRQAWGYGPARASGDPPAPRAGEWCSRSGRHRGGTAHDGHGVHRRRGQDRRDRRDR